MFYFPSPYHPNAGKTNKWGWPFVLPIGRSFATATVTVVDATGAAVGSPDLIIADVSPGQIDATTNTWQIVFFPHGMAASPQYFIRFDWTLDETSPGGLPIGDYLIVALNCSVLAPTN